MLVSTLVLLAVVVAIVAGAAIWLSLRAAFERIDLSLKQIVPRLSSSVGEVRRDLHMVQGILRATAFHANPAVKDVVEALRADAPYSAHEPCYSVTRLMNNLEISRPVKSSSDIVICTVAVGDGFREAVRGCLDSHRLYAERHGYQYAVLENLPLDPERPFSWMKVPLILKLFGEGAKRVFYIDADAMITNAETRLETFFAKFEGRSDLYLTEDESGVNMGVLFALDTLGARRILDLIWLYDADVNHSNWEQQAFKAVLNNLPEVRRHVMFETQPKAFNSFPPERRLIHKTRDKSIWTSGDFVCHFSGMRSPELERFVRDYAKALPR